MSPEPTSARSALVAGGTGLVGGHLLQLLGADAGYHRVVSLARRQGAAPRGVDVQVVDFERLDEFVPPPVTEAFCCLGTTRKAAGSARGVQARRLRLHRRLRAARHARRCAAFHAGVVDRRVIAVPLALPANEGRVRSRDQGDRVQDRRDFAAVLPGRRTPTWAADRGSGDAGRPADQARAVRSPPAICTGRRRGGGADACPMRGDCSRRRHGRRIRRHSMSPAVNRVRFGGAVPLSAPTPALEGLLAAGLARHRRQVRAGAWRRRRRGRHLVAQGANLVDRPGDLVAGHQPHL